MDLLRDLYTRFRVLIHEVAKFGVVGILAFVITIVGTNVLRYGVGLGPLTSVTIATVVATVFAFMGNKLWAFRHRNGSHWGRESVLFFVFNGIGLLIQLSSPGSAIGACLCTIPPSVEEPGRSSSSTASARWRPSSS